jgi:hypothetical protein
MGYTTMFTGRVTISPALNPYEISYLQRFAEVRHMHRTKGPYFVAGGGYAGQAIEPDVVADGREAHPGQPGFWCQWVPVEDGSAIEWDGGEKFYDAEKWMAYLIETFLKPGATVAHELADPVPDWVYPEEFAHLTFDHIVNGVIGAQGEESEDWWRLEVRDNAVYVIRDTVEPDYDEIDPADPGEWGDAQWAEFAAKTRHNVAFVVREGELCEVDSNPPNDWSSQPV